MRYLFLFIIAFLSLPFAASAQGLSMSPTRLFFTGNPGETVTERVILYNSSPNNYVVAVNYKDWKREDDGSKSYSKANTLKNSNASWLSTVEKTINIPAGESKEVLVTMQIPRDASSGVLTNSMLFFTQLPIQDDKKTVGVGLGIVTLFEFGLHVFYTPSGEVLKSVEITGIEEISNPSTKSRTIAVAITNDGNGVNDATVGFEFTNTQTGEEIKLEVKRISMMPQTKQIVEFVVPENLSGAYLGIAIVKMAGSNDVRVGEKSFSF